MDTGLGTHMHALQAVPLIHPLDSALLPAQVLGLLHIPPMLRQPRLQLLERHGLMLLYLRRKACSQDSDVPACKHAARCFTLKLCPLSTHPTWLQACKLRWCIADTKQQDGVQHSERACSTGFGRHEQSIACACACAFAVISQCAYASSWETATGNRPGNNRL